jgi:hypothetical protein
VVHSLRTGSDSLAEFQTIKDPTVQSGMKSEKSDSVLRLNRHWIECATVFGFPEPDMNRVNDLMFDLRAIAGVHPDDVIAPVLRIKNEGLEPEIPAFFALDAVTFKQFNRNGAALLLLVEPLAEFPPV